MIKISSKNFPDNGKIPSEFTCDGKNVSPHLSWTNVPDNTKSFALKVTDPDAIGGWVHWLVYDIPKEVTAIDQNNVPMGAKEVENDFGKKTYGGPCPPSGTHRYVFTVFALDVEHLVGVNKRNFESKVKNHALDSAKIVGLYKRKR